MKRPIRLGLAVAGLLAATVGVATAASASPWTGHIGQHAAANLAASAPAAADVGPHPHSTYIPITPCRLVDTRKVGGAIPNGHARSFDARDLFDENQGGQEDCNFSTRASAVQATLTVIGAHANGVLKAYPTDQPEPTATLLNFGTAFNASATGAVTLCTKEHVHCAGDLAIKVLGSSANVVVDVLGYYVQPLYARVTADGKGTGSQLESVQHTGTGTYEVSFAGSLAVIGNSYRFGDDNITQCAVSTSVGGPSTSQVEPPQGYAVGNVVLGVDEFVGSVHVHTFDKNGTPADLPFSVVLTC
jgi:hypothetical protein